MYEPRPFLGGSIEEYVSEELRSVAQAQQDKADFLLLSELHVAPAKPRTGMLVLADGTDWNPGSGAGFYGYYGAAWVKLG